MGARRALQDIVAITDANIFTAVAECEAEDPACQQDLEWRHRAGTCSFDCPASQATYGRIADWDVSGVTTFNNWGTGCTETYESRCGGASPPTLHIHGFCSAVLTTLTHSCAQCFTRVTSTAKSPAGIQAA